MQRGEGRSTICNVLLGSVVSSVPSLLLESCHFCQSLHPEIKRRITVRSNKKRHPRPHPCKKILNANCLDCPWAFFLSPPLQFSLSLPFLSVSHQICTYIRSVVVWTDVVRWTPVQVVPNMSLFHSVVRRDTNSHSTATLACEPKYVPLAMATNGLCENAMA